MPDLARAAFDAGADSVVMAGRLLGFIPDVETLAPMLGTSLGIGGFWNLPLTCHWLARTRAALGTGQAADRHQRRAERARHRAHDAGGRLGGRDGVAGDAARVRVAGGFAARVLRLSRRGRTCAPPTSIGRAADQRKTFADMPLRTDNWRNYVPKV